MSTLSIVILAAGKGSRMLSSRSKVLHPIGGSPMINHTLACARTLNPQQLIIVHNAAEDNLKTHLSSLPTDTTITWVNQATPQGTAHALQQALPHLTYTDNTLVLLGDAPLINAESVLKTLVENTPANAIGLVTTQPADPSHLGRIIRNQNGNITRIIEHKDATPEQQQQCREVFSGLMLVPNAPLTDWLAAITPNNQQNERYLTDIVTLAHQDNVPIVGTIASNPLTVLGINTRSDLALAERFYQQTTAQQLLIQGIGLADPNRFDLRGTLQFGQDVFIDINTVLEGRILLGNNVKIGMGCHLSNVTLGDNVQIKPYTTLEGATIGENSVIGPFARIRPETRIEKDVKIGNFVEVKNSTINHHSKASHLTYIGDATIGQHVNIGAGTITCNYDGQKKHPTTIEDHVMIGAGCQLIAPITLGDSALIGAGSVITHNAPKNKLTLSRSPQKTVTLPPAYKKKNRQKNEMSEPESQANEQET